MDPRTRELWARTTLRVWPESYRLVSLRPSMLAEAAALLSACGTTFVALVKDDHEVTLTIDNNVWRYSRLRWQALADDGPFRVLTFDLELALDVVGYLVPVAERLAVAGFAIVVQSGHRTDHLLVRDPDGDRAVAVIGEWIAECRG